MNIYILKIHYRSKENNEQNINDGKKNKKKNSKDDGVKSDKKKNKKISSIEDSYKIQNEKENILAECFIDLKDLLNGNTRDINKNFLVRYPIKTENFISNYPKNSKKDFDKKKKDLTSKKSSTLKSSESLKKKPDATNINESEDSPLEINFQLKVLDFLNKNEIVSYYLVN